MLDGDSFLDINATSMLDGDSFLDINVTWSWMGTDYIIPKEQEYIYHKPQTTIITILIQVNLKWVND